MIIEPVQLEGEHVRLEPLGMRHHADLWAVGLDEEIWRWNPKPVSSSEEMKEYIGIALRWQAEGTALPFATISKAAARAVGSTRFAHIDIANRRAEIGWTWLGRQWQRTVLNTEAKFLMLRHAFEVLGCIRVELKTDALNERSRAAILRIGAKEEGILRKHMTTSTGRFRDTVYYSILDTEWSGVKATLEQKLAQNHSSK